MDNEGIIEKLQSAVAGEGGGRGNQVNSIVTQPQSSYFPLPSSGRGWGGGFWECIIDFFSKIDCKWTANEGGGGGVMKRFQNLSGDQVNFMVKIKILRPPTGSCNFVAFEKFTRAY